MILVLRNRPDNIRIAEYDKNAGMRAFFVMETMPSEYPQKAR